MEDLLKKKEHNDSGSDSGTVVAASPNFTRAYRLLESPDRWTTGATARDASGSMVGVDSPSAVCWDILGALQKVYGYSRSARIAEDLETMLEPEMLVAWNDRVKHEDVYALLRDMDL